MRRYVYLLLTMAACLLAACRTMEYMSVDYMLPADVSFPASLRKVAVVNNAPPAPDELPYGLPKLTAEALAEGLAAESYFDEVVICDSALCAPTDSTPARPLTTEEVNLLTRELGADFLIAVEAVSVEAVRRSMPAPEWAAFRATADARVRPVVRVYLPNRKGPMVTLAPTDSIYWEQPGLTETEARAQLPTDKELREEASRFAGTIPVKFLLPHWKQGDRYLFGGGSVAMRDALVLAKEQDWQAAIALWKQVYTAGKSKQKLQAACNLALGYEMLDSIDTACCWAKCAQEEARKAEKLDQLPAGATLNLNDYPATLMTTLYLSELEERRTTLLKLRTQMHRFDNEE